MRPASRPPSPPLLAHWLLRIALRGPLAEAVIGDLEERYRSQFSAFDRRQADRSYRKQAALSLLAWWQPAAVRERSLARRRRTVTPRHRQPGERRSARGEQGTTPMSLLHDVRLAWRALAARPVFALTVIAILALGIGATTTVYSVVDGVLLRDLPYRDAARLVIVGTTSATSYAAPLEDEDTLYHLMGSAVGNFVEWRERSRTMEDLVAAERRPLNLVTEAGPEPTPAAAVTRGFFATLRVVPAMGRLFVEGEHRAGTDDVAILSHGAWVRHFGADPAAIGRRLETTSGSFDIVGVLPEHFRSPHAVVFADVDVWTPLAEDDPGYENRGRRSIVAMGRLAPGATLSAARLEMWALAERAAEEVPEGNVFPDGGRFGAGVNPMRDEAVGGAGRLLWALFGAVSLLLLVACVNVAGLLLSHGVERAHELSIRAAIGAGRGRLIRQLLAENLLLAAVGGALGIGLAVIGVRAFVAASPGSIPRLGEVAVDARILAFTIIVSSLTGILFGLVPALRLSRSAPADALRGGTSTTGTSGRRFLSALVAAEVALAVVLLIGAGLLMHSLMRLHNVDSGYDDTDIMVFRVSAPGGFGDAPATSTFVREVLESAATLPGVVAVASASNAPAEQLNWRSGMYREGESPENGLGRGVDAIVVSADYFRVLGIPVLAGRLPEPDMTTPGAAAASDVVVNQAFVEAYLDGAAAPGFEFRMTMPAEDGPQSVRIAAVVGDIRQTHPSVPPEPTIYVSRDAVAWPELRVLLQMQPGVSLSERTVRDAIRALDPTVPVRTFSSLRSRLDATKVEPRFYTWLLSAFATLALLLASAGIYATVAYSVGQRTRELGIRMALGARAASVRSLVVRQGAWTIAIGIILGVAGAWLLTGVLAQLLFEIGPRDVATYLATAGAFAVVALVAMWIPASRTTRIDVLQALRGE